MRAGGVKLSELEQVLTGDSAAAAPAVILEALSGELAHRLVDGAPHTIYEELWHIAFWQRMTLDWIEGIGTPYPVHASAGFPTGDEVQLESWDELRQRFFRGLEQAALAARNVAGLEQPIHCPSRPGASPRIMTVREQLESRVAHNADHFGRIVLLRQLLRSWPPPAGGSTW